MLKGTGDGRQLRHRHRGQDRHDERLHRRLVHRVHPQAHRRGVDGLPRRLPVDDQPRAAPSGGAQGGGEPASLWRHFMTAVTANGANAELHRVVQRRHDLPRGADRLAQQPGVVPQGARAPATTTIPATPLRSSHRPARRRTPSPSGPTHHGASWAVDHRRCPRPRRPCPTPAPPGRVRPPRPPPPH